MVLAMLYSRHSMPQWLGREMLPGVSVCAVLMFIFATPIQFVFGRRFHIGAYKVSGSDTDARTHTQREREGHTQSHGERRAGGAFCMRVCVRCVCVHCVKAMMHGSPNMDVLISLATNLTFGYSTLVLIISFFQHLVEPHKPKPCTTPAMPHTLRTLNTTHTRRVHFPLLIPLSLSLCPSLSLSVCASALSPCGRPGSLFRHVCRAHHCRHAGQGDTHTHTHAHSWTRRPCVRTRMCVSYDVPDARGPCETSHDGGHRQVYTHAHTHGFPFHMCLPGCPVCACVRVCVSLLALQPHTATLVEGKDGYTHTHTHTQRERERERGRGTPSQVHSTFRCVGVCVCAFPHGQRLQRRPCARDPVRAHPGGRSAQGLPGRTDTSRRHQTGIDRFTKQHTHTHTMTPPLRVCVCV